MGHVTAAFDQDDWRWRNDDGNESSGGASFVAAAGVEPVIDIAEGAVDLRLRIAVSETAGGSRNQGWDLEWREVGIGGWTTLTTTADSFFGWQAYDSTNLTDAADTTNHGVTGTGSFITANSGVCEDGSAPNASYSGNDFVILEFTVRAQDATSLANGDRFEFRVAGADSYTAGHATCEIKLRASLAQEDWRWRNDNGNELEFAFGGATFAAAAQTDISVDVTSGNVDRRVRFAVTATQNARNPYDTGTTSSRLEYRKNGGSWTNVTTTSSNVQAFASQLSDGANTSNHGVTPDASPSFKTANDAQSDDGLANGFDHFWAGSDWFPIEYSLRFIAADLADGDTIDVRVANLDTYTVDMATATIVKSAGGRRIFVVS